ncbi:MAG: hypothetical protein HQ402_02750 [Parcubacteria group bacterium]|nr:hypothetical protein [Parcubacteria group bacterium]
MIKTIMRPRIKKVKVNITYKKSNLLAIQKTGRQRIKAQSHFLPLPHIPNNIVDKIGYKIPKPIINSKKDTGGPTLITLVPPLVKLIILFTIYPKG